MSHLATSSPTTSTRSTRWRRPAARWLLSFAGFPLGGYLATAVVGPVDGATSAVVGGLVTGLVLGAVQAWALAEPRQRAAAWVAATAVGFMTGLGVGASLVDFGTSLGDLMIQGAVSGAAVGLAQALVLLPRLGARALLWPAALGGVWAVGWAITTSAGVHVEEQFTVFGSSGALVVTALTAVLPVLLSRTGAERSAS